MTRLAICLTGLLVLSAPAASAQQQECEPRYELEESLLACYRLGQEITPPVVKPDRFRLRVLRYATLAVRHKLAGLASYYSSYFDGRPTANGETFRNRQLTAAHLTLPLGTWIEVKSRATGRKIRLRVNDRGPYAKKFTLDLSQAAARALGVDVARDRYVEMRVIALPGEEPLPDGWEELSDPALASAVNPEE